MNLEVVGYVGTERNWAERKSIILPLPRPSIEVLLEGHERDGESLGVIKPAEISDVWVEKDESEWSSSHQQMFAQLRLFGPQPKHLERPNHRFSYRFRCEDAGCKGHRMQINDWGLSWLYLRTLREEGEAAAVRKTEQKCWEMIGADKDTYLYVGTVYPKRSFIILGVFWPKKEPTG
jgi:hypothetical protein